MRPVEVCLPGLCLLPEVLVWQSYIEQHNLLVRSKVFISRNGFNENFENSVWKTSCNVKNLRRLLFGLAMMKFSINLFSALHFLKRKPNHGFSENQLLTTPLKISIISLLAHDLPIGISDCRFQILKIKGKIYTDQLVILIF